MNQAHEWFEQQKISREADDWEPDVPEMIVRGDPEGGWQGEEFDSEEIPFPTKEELIEYFEYLAEELEMDVSDVWRMYFGYEPKGAAA